MKVKTYQQVAVAGLLIVDNKALVVRRSSKESFLPGYYEIPGGKVVFGEHPDKSLEREFEEEVGLSVSPVSVFRVFHYVTREGKCQTVEIVYLVKLKGKLEELKLSDAHDHHDWITVEQVKEYKLSKEISKDLKEGFKIYKLLNA